MDSPPGGRERGEGYAAEKKDTKLKLSGSVCGYQLMEPVGRREC